LRETKRLLYHIVEGEGCEMAKINKINCFHCVHFAITWDTKFPKACKAFGFKTANMPSVAVFQSTGIDCIAFIAKQKTEAGKMKKD
jgi:hypothetical protein